MLNQMRTKLSYIMASLLALMGLATPAYAEGAANQAVVTAMTSLADDVIATIGPIAAVAVGVFAIFLAFKYGKRIFTTVAK